MNLQFEKFEKNVVEVYSKLHGSIDASQPCAVSFQGSQKPFEFFCAWDIISEKLKDVESPSFLEIGAWKGLWAIAFFEWCKLNNKKGRYTTVTWLEHDPNNSGLPSVKDHYIGEGFDFNLISASSQLLSTKNIVTNHQTSYDFVFIDADHRYEGVTVDINFYSPLATKILAFHDIKPVGGGVERAIKDAGIKFDNEFCCAEDLMGIGIKLI